MAERKQEEAEAVTERAAAPAEKDAAAKKPARKPARKGAPSRDEVIQHYLRVYERCTQEEPKAFDAKGALSALDQIAKVLGYDTPAKAQDGDGEVRVLLSAEAEKNGG